MPFERHKLAAYKNWVHRLLRLPLIKSNKRKELSNIMNRAPNNGHKKDDIMNLHNRLKYQQNDQGSNTKTEQKWVTFTYTRNYVRKITKLFKDINLKIAFKTTASLGKLLGDTRTTNTYEHRGMYKMTCQSCHKVEQRDRNLTTRLLFYLHIGGWNQGPLDTAAT
jgi:hypothetical protein